MRIGIDCRSIVDLADGELAGVGYYTFFLVKTLVERYPEHTFVLFVNRAHHLEESVYSLHTKSNVEIVAIAENGSIPFWTSHVTLARAVREARCDLFHAPAYVAPLLLRGVPTVVTVHDLAIYDHPEWFAAQSPLSKRVLVPRSLRRADAVIAVSQATAEQVVRHFPAVESRVHVVYEAAVLPEVMMHEVEETMVGLRRYHKITQKFFFFVGTIEPRKNLVRVIHAFEQMMMQLRQEEQVDTESVQLIVAGGLGWKYDEVQRAIAEAVGRQVHVKWIDYVSQTEKVALIANAEALVLASLDEGFGLPALEAMELGTPVIASEVGALAEVTGGHALLVDPYAVESIQDAMLRAAQEPESLRTMTGEAQKYVQQYTWKHAAEQTMHLYESVLS
jgi:glycosyltransferase involved in cell wall biosynthesis